ncbi:MAG: J domain-containing protein [Candidatus Brocadiaceae bacterium]|nr:J domain-containing protein [Candidatus Brocadiaceae bacterium]
MERPANGESHYATLAVSPDATGQEIKRAYRRKVRELHPDVKTRPCNVEQFQAVRRAYEVLADPDERAFYDLLMGFGPRTARPRVYRRSFEHLFDSLFSGLHTAVNNTAEQWMQMDPPRREAG